MSLPCPSWKDTVVPKETEPPISILALLEMSSDPVPLTSPLISMNEISLLLNGPAMTVPLLTRFPTVKTVPGEVDSVTPEFTERLLISTFVVLVTVYVPVASIATFALWVGTPLLQSEEVFQNPSPEWVQ